MALDARATAAKILGRVIAGKSLNQAMPKLLGEAPERDQALVQQLCYGSLRQYPRLKAVLGQLLDKPLRGKDSDVFALMIIGLYQLDALRVPDHAAVAATVEATRGLGKPWAKGLTNAILRRFLRFASCQAKRFSIGNYSYKPAITGKKQYIKADGGVFHPE